MNRHVIITGSVTYAIKGRDLLKRHGFRATVERNATGISRFGCGYGIVVIGDIDSAVELLKQNGVKILEVDPVI